MNAHAAAIEGFINETTRCFGAPPASVVLRRGETEMEYDNTKHRLSRPIEELRDDPNVSRENLLLLELVAVAFDEGMSEREAQKLVHELLVHFGGDVEAALEAFAAGDVRLANGKLLIEEQKPQTVSDAIQALVADGMVAPTGAYRPGRDGKLEPVYALTDKGLAEQLRYTEAKGNG
jgi:hypothetical protein